MIMRTYLRFILKTIAVVCVSAEAHAESYSEEALGHVSLKSQYIDDGLTQTDNSPAIQASFWYHAGPQFKLGLWGSNVNYRNEDDVFNLRISANIKTEFNATNSMNLAYSKSLYFNDGNRDGDLFGLHLSFSGFKIMYDTKSNWEGTSDRLTRFALGYAHTFPNEWIWTNSLGHNSIKNDEIEDYFDLKTSLGSYLGKILIEGSITGTTTPDQFDGQGDIFITLSLSTEI